jgi:hypothetical protein
MKPGDLRQFHSKSIADSLKCKSFFIVRIALPNEFIRVFERPLCLILINGKARYMSKEYIDKHSMHLCGLE